MNKALLIADLHSHHKPQWRVEWLQQFAKSICQRDDNDGEKQLWLLGDSLELRDRQRGVSIDVVLDLLAGWKGKKVFITGQHDQRTPGIASLRALPKLFSGSQELLLVEDDIACIGDDYFIPFARDLNKYREMLSRVPDGKNVFTHTPVKEALGPFADENSISAKEFDRFNIAVSGDIHEFNEYRKLHYVGAPSQRDFRDKKVEGQIGHWDGSVFWREATTHPKHIEVKSIDEYERVKKLPGEVIIRASRELLREIKLEGKVKGAVESIAQLPDAKSISVAPVVSPEEAIAKYVEKNPYTGNGIAGRGLELYRESLNRE